jgi:methylmalonyl-CoA/ethylmalonyl-CoA epimerase
MIKSVSHLGIATDDLAKSVSLYHDVLGMKLIAETEMPEMGLKVAIMEAGGDHIELLESTREDSAIGRFLARHGPGIHHVSLEVEDIESALAHLKEKGLRLIDQTPRVGARGRRIAFLHPKSTHGVLIELSEAGH